MRVENNKGGKGNFGKQLLDGTKLALGNQLENGQTQTNQVNHGFYGVQIVNQLEKKTGNLLTNGFHYHG